MRHHAGFGLLLAVAVPVTLAGCVKLARESPQLQRYVLGGAAAATPSVTGSAASSVQPPFTVGLSRAEVASYLTVSGIMMRRGPNQLVTSEFHRWGGDLDQGINRALGAYLASSPRVSVVDIAPWTARAHHTVLVQLHVMRFEGVVADSMATDGRTHVLVGWEILRPRDGAVLVRGTTDDRGDTFRVGDYSGLVSGLDAGLARVARDIGACLARFPTDSTPPASCDKP